MRHHRDSCRDERRDRFGLGRAPFQLDGLSLGFLQNAAGVFHRFERPGVPVRKGQIDDQQRMFDGAADHLGVVNHFVERDR